MNDVLLFLKDYSREVFYSGMMVLVLIWWTVPKWLSDPKEENSGLTKEESTKL